MQQELDKQPRGILKPGAMPAKYQLERRQPAPDLAYFVQCYWIVSWDLRGQPPFESETLPYPCVHLAIEPGRSGVFGVVTGRFTTRLAGAGRVLGVKFRPGGFRGLLGAPVHTLTDTVTGLGAMFGAAGQALERSVLAQPDTGARIAIAEQFLRARQPAPDANAELAGQVVDTIIADRSIVRVGDAAGQFGLSARTLQRLFREYVGVGPKWVIKRFRLQEAAGQIARDGSVALPALAAELGYFDQAHFINDFKTLVGQTPAAYAKSLAADT